MKKYRLEIKTLILVTLVLVSYLLHNRIGTMVMENYKKDARYSVDRMISCVHKVGSNVNVVKAIDICADDSLIGGKTGDVFVFNAKTRVRMG